MKRGSRTTHALRVAAVFSALSALAFGQGFTIKTIDFPGAYATQPVAINNEGQVVGVYASPHGHHGFLRDSEGNFHTIDCPGGAYTLVDGINDSGQILGTCVESGTGFLLTGGRFTAIRIPGSSFTDAGGLNNRGQIVGRYETSSGEHGYLLTGSTVRNIDYPGAAATVPSAINNFGEIVGYYEMADLTLHGFIFNGGVFTDITIPSGSPATLLTGINDMGVITGGGSQPLLSKSLPSPVAPH